MRLDRFPMGWAAAVLLAVPLATAVLYFTAVVVPEVRRDTVNEALARLDRAAGNRAAAIDRTNENLLRETALVSSFPVVRELVGDGTSPGDVHVEEILSLVKGSLRLRGLFVTDVHGRIVAGQSPEHVTDVDRELVVKATRRAVATREAAMQIEVGEFDPEHDVAYAQPVRASADGTPLGAVVAIETTLEPPDVSASPTTTVVIAHEGSAPQLLPDTGFSSWSEPLRRVATGAPGGSGEFGNEDGTGVLAAVRPVSGLPVTVVAWVDRDVALAPYRERVRGDAQFLAGWLLAAGVGVWLLWRTGKSRAEAQAAEERARAAEVFESVNDAVFVTTLDGTILDVNELAVDAYGWSRDEFRRMRGEDLRAPIGGPTVQERLAEASRRGVMVYETRHRRRDGTSFPVEISFRRLNRAGGDIFIAVARNITERDAATRRIRRLNQLLRTLFEVDALIVRERDRERLMQGLCSIVAEHGGYALVWVGVPDAASERLVVAAGAGVARGYLDGLQVSTGDVPGGRAPSSVALREGRVVITRDLASAPAMAPWRDRLLHFGLNVSAAVPIVAGERTVGVLTVYSVDDEAFDADTRPLLEQFGRDLGFAFDSIESEAQLRGFLDTGAVAMAVFELRGDDGVLVLANRRFAELAGTTVDRLVGRTGREAGMPEELRRSWTDAFRRAIQQRESVSMEFPWRTPQGSYWLQGTLTPLEQASAHHPRAAFAAIDVTARHDAEEKLRQAQKMEAIGRLAGGVAHDFNNLLTAILGYTELIQLSLDATDPRALHLAEVRRAGERAAELTRQLLAFGRKQVLRPAVLDVNAIVHDVERLMSRLIGEHITLELELQPDLRSVLADRGQFEQVLVNLAVNARDAMPTGGRLAISTGCDDLEVWLRVRDTGTGIAPEHVQHIFEPFFTTKEKDKGTGLGLATVYGIVEQSGGRITVETELGRGTTFTIRFPAVPREAAESPPRPAQKPAARVPEATVLLVEDEDAVRRFVAAALRAAGLGVVEAGSPAEAIQILRAVSAPIDVLLSDVVMPGMNGFDLAVEARRLRPGLRAIFMSGYADGALAQGARPGPDDVVLAKPFSTEVLVDHLRRRLQDA